MADPFTDKLEGATDAARAEMQARAAALANTEFSFGEDEADGFSFGDEEPALKSNQKPNGDTRISVNTTRGITVWQRPDGSTYTEPIGGGTGGTSTSGAAGGGTSTTGTKAAAKPTGAITQAELEEGGAAFPAPGIAQMGGYEYKKNTDGSWSVSRAIAAPVKSNRSLTLNPKLTAATKRQIGSQSGYASPSGAENRAQIEIPEEWDVARAKGMESLVPIPFGIEGMDEPANAYINGAAGTGEVRFPTMRLGDQDVSMGQSFRTGDILRNYGIDSVSPEVDFANVLQLDRRRSELANQGLQPEQYNKLIQAEMAAGTFAPAKQFAEGGEVITGSRFQGMTRSSAANPAQGGRVKMVMNPYTGKMQAAWIRGGQFVRFLNGGGSLTGPYGAGGGGGGGGAGGFGFGLSSPMSQDFYGGSPWGTEVSFDTGSTSGGMGGGGGGRGRGRGGGAMAQGGQVVVGDEPMSFYGDWSGRRYGTMGELNAFTGRPTREVMQVTPLEESIPFVDNVALGREQNTRNNELGLTERGRHAVNVLSR